MFFFSFSSGGGRWSVGPLLFALPMLVPWDMLASLLLGTARTVAKLVGLQQGEADIGELMVQLLFLGIFAFGVVRFVRYVQRNGGWSALVRLLFLGASGGAAATAAGAGRPGLYATVQQARQQQQQQQQQQQRRPPRATTEQVAAVLQKLPTEVFATAADLEAMSAPELKERAAARGIELGMIVEKQELIQQLSAQDRDNSSACTCAVCSEDYESGDVLRVLRCGHKFHIECVDRWLLACDFSRPPACPMCNAEVLPRAT